MILFPNSANTILFQGPDVAVEIEDYIVQNLIILSETVVLTSFKCVSHLASTTTTKTFSGDLTDYYGDYTPLMMGTGTLSDD